MGRSFIKESMVAGGIATGGVVILVGLRMIASIASRRLNGHRLIEQRTIMGEWIVVAGVAICVISFVVGLLFAFGIGFHKKLEGATVEERIVTLTDGTEVYDDQPDDVPLKRYLRLRTSHGDVVEVRCSSELFHAAREGAVGTANLSGGKLISFVRTGQRTH